MLTYAKEVAGITLLRLQVPHDLLRRYNHRLLLKQLQNVD